MLEVEKVRPAAITPRRPRMPKKQTEWTRAYNEKAYDRISVTIPKGQKQAVEAHAKSKGTSVNGLINDLLRADMGVSDGDWKSKEKN